MLYCINSNCLENKTVIFVWTLGFTVTLCCCRLSFINCVAVGGRLGGGRAAATCYSAELSGQLNQACV